MNLPSGHLLQNGKYRLTHFVGQGGFGITYKGIWFTEVKGALGTVKAEVPIAIKEYFFKDYCYREESSYAVRVHSETGKNIFDKFKEKLIREARILSDVHHPHIVNVLEVFEENNTAYIAMEYISGMSLKEKMEREGILPEAKLLKYVHQIGEALQFVHDNNILHLDVKPSNILIDRRDNARLIDFGVSKRYDAKQQETSTAMLTLSKGFASIEQYDNEGTLSFSPYPDVYSLGASMYNLLTGRIPVESILRATRPLPEPSVLNPNISPKTESVIMKAMAIVPTDRYQTVREMMEGLDRPPEEETNAGEQTDEDFRIFTNDKGDTTIIYPPNNGKPLQVEDESEQTILNDSVEDESDSLDDSRKRLSRIIYLIIFVLFALVVIFVFYNENQKQKAASEKEPIILPIEKTDTTETNNPLATEIPADTTVLQNQEQQPEPIADEPVPPPSDNREEPTITNPPDVQAEQQAQPEKTDLNATYSSLIASGEEKMLREEYRAAEVDFRKAKDLSPENTLLDRVINEAAGKAKEKESADRKALYEVMMPFGNLIIVKEISTKKIGAVNEEYAIVIPCKYLLVNPGAGETRIFVRENGVDTYNSDGKLIPEGSNN